MASSAADSAAPVAPQASVSLIASVAIVGRSNEPLYFKCFLGGPEEYIKLQMSSFTALDVVEDKVRLQQEERSTRGVLGSTDPFLGLLLPVEEFKVFGYLTSTYVKIIVAVRDVLLREDKVREMFKNLHRLYVDASSNPFGRADGRITSAAFEKAIAAVVDASNTNIEYRSR